MLKVIVNLLTDMMPLHKNGKFFIWFKRMKNLSVSSTFFAFLRAPRKTLMVVSGILMAISTVSLGLTVQYKEKLMKDIATNDISVNYSRIVLTNGSVTNLEIPITNLNDLATFPDLELAVSGQKLKLNGEDDWVT